MTVSTPEAKHSTASPESFESILFPAGATPIEPEEVEAPSYFDDLNLDQVIEAVTASRAAHNLTPFFWKLLGDAAAIRYRQEVLRDLEPAGLREVVERFATAMQQVRATLGREDGTRNPRQRRAWFLQAVGAYQDAVLGLAQGLDENPGCSSGFRSLTLHLGGFTQAQAFLSLGAEQKRIGEALAEIRYTVRIRGDRVQVDDFDGEIDYGEEIRDTFDRFRQGKVKGYRFRYDRDLQMNHVETQIFDLVAKLNPEPFADLERFEEDHRDFLDPLIARLDRELQFYLSYLDYIEAMRDAGLPFCLPVVEDGSKEVGVTETFDLGLAAKLVGEGSAVVTNDWALSGAERIFVISGPNQGGKTTFARAFGQLHYLARLGLSVPGRDGRLLLCDRVFTQFERREDHSNLSGKLEDDLIRVREILDQATPRSIIVMNESFSSTALEDARLLGRRVLERISDLDSLCVYVTFVDELASLNEKVVSLTSTVDPEDPTTRTFKVVRRPADGRAYAIAIAEKYGLTSDRLTERIAR